MDNNPGPANGDGHTIPPEVWNLLIHFQVVAVVDGQPSAVSRNVQLCHIKVPPNVHVCICTSAQCQDTTADTTCLVIEGQHQDMKICGQPLWENFVVKFPEVEQLLLHKNANARMVMFVDNKPGHDFVTTAAWFEDATVHHVLQRICGNKRHLYKVMLDATGTARDVLFRQDGACYFGGVQTAEILVLRGLKATQRWTHQSAQPWFRDLCTYFPNLKYLVLQGCDFGHQWLFFSHNVTLMTDTASPGRLHTTGATGLCWFGERINARGPFVSPSFQRHTNVQNLMLMGRGAQGAGPRVPQDGAHDRHAGAEDCVRGQALGEGRVHQLCPLPAGRDGAA